MRYAFVLKDSHPATLDHFIKSIQQNVTLLPQTKETHIDHYYDTFDWRLYRSGYYLYYAAGKLTLHNFRKHLTVISESLTPEPGKGLLEPTVNIKKKIIPLLSVRKLLYQASLHRNEQSYRLLNKDQKTITRLTVQKYRIREGNRYRPVNTTLVFYPLRGYGKALESALHLIPGLEDRRSDEDYLLRGLQSINRRPGAYSSKYSLQLSAQMTAESAVKSIFLHLLSVMRMNETGIIKDYDTEFLHDFRVSVRRTRSALSQLKYILDSDASKKMKDNFSFLGNATNKLRDLDVYLMNEKKYMAMIPDNALNALQPFFDQLRRERNKEHKSLIQLLRSKKYRLILKNWEKILKTESGESDRLANRERPVTDVASEVIYKRNQKILKFGKEILETASDGRLHKLRIEAKKLRYLLEFFRSLFPEKIMDELILKLKRLQDHLGEFNDLVVQQKTLCAYATSISLGKDDGKETILTLGILIGKLNDREKNVKASFAYEFKLYSNKRLQNKFNSLFPKPAQEPS